LKGKRTGSARNTIKKNRYIRKKENEAKIEGGFEEI
jgi:hypothetical protein